MCNPIIMVLNIDHARYQIMKSYVSGYLLPMMLCFVFQHSSEAPSVAVLQMTDTWVDLVVISEP
jgi:hypothetical protein